MTITKPAHGATGWDTATNAAIDILNLITPNGLNSDIQETARDAVGSALVAGTNMGVVVDDTGNTITLNGLSDASLQEIARDAVGAALVAGAGISIVVDDAGNTITITNTSSGSTPALPSPVSAAGSGSNVFTAGTGTAGVWFDLSTVPANVSITNPDSTYDLTVLISVGAWLITATSGVDVRLGYRTTGDIVTASGPGLSAVSPPSWGHVPLNANPSASVSFAAAYTGVIPAGGTVNFISQSFFSSTTGQKQCNYPGIQITPLHYNL